MTLCHDISLPARGWTAERRVRFLDHLSLKGNVRAACARVGLSAEAAYRLRRRDALFARGWAAALVLGREASEQVLATRALDGVEQAVFHGGEEVGSRTVYDTRLLLAHLARLDRVVEEDEQALSDAGRFDEVLALVAGESFAEELAGEDAALPVTRNEAVGEAVADAQDRVFREAWISAEEREGEDDAEAVEAALVRAGAAAGSAAGACWDGWFARACAVVDAVVAAQGVGGEARAEAGSGDKGHRDKAQRRFSPGTVSTVSTSALALALGHAANGLPMPQLPSSAQPHSPFRPCRYPNQKNRRRRGQG